MDISSAKHTLLTKIACHDGEWGWYQIERGFDSRNLPEGVTAMTLVDDLVEEGLLEVIAGEPIDRYRLTARGKATVAPQ